MAEPRRIAVFDVGKTSSKLTLLDGQDLAEIGSRRCSNVPLSGPPYPHLDTEAQWAFLCQGLAAFQAEHGVDAIAITTHGATAALVTDTELATPVLDYEYPLPTNPAYARLRPDFAKTYSPALPNGLNLGAQLYYLQQSVPDSFARAHHVLTYPQYWCWRLTGQARSERTSLGVHTDLWHPSENRFSDVVGKIFPGSLFPPLANPDDVFELSATAADDTGLPAGLPVTCGIHDSNASLLPWLNVSGDLSVISTGTWCITMALGGRLDGLDPSRDMLANVDALGRPVPTARFMGGREFAMLCAGAEGPITPQAISQVVDAGYMACPGTTGKTGPFPNGQGGWHGTEPPDHLKPAAATLYLAMMTETCLRLVNSGNKIVVEGPFGKNPMFGSVLAALGNRQVHVSGDATGTSLGAAMLISRSHPVVFGTAEIAPNLVGLPQYHDAWLTNCT